LDVRDFGGNSRRNEYMTCEESKEIFQKR